MRPRSVHRGRRGIAWWMKTAGFAAALLLFILWVSSGWWRWTWHLGSMSEGTLVGMGEGTLAVMRLDTRVLLEQGMSVDAFLQGLPLHAWDGWRPFHLELWFSFVDSTAGMHWHFAIPMWVFVAAAAGVWVEGWRMEAILRRRELAGVCVKCGYDRAGLASGAACPECGTRV